MSTGMENPCTNIDPIKRAKVNSFLQADTVASVVKEDEADATENTNGYLDEDRLMLVLAQYGLTIRPDRSDLHRWFIRYVQHHVTSPRNAPRKKPRF
jgi:hypothetical protein